MKSISTALIVVAVVAVSALYLLQQRPYGFQDAPSGPAPLPQNWILIVIFVVAGLGSLLSLIYLRGNIRF